MDINTISSIVVSSGVVTGLVQVIKTQLNKVKFKLPASLIVALVGVLGFCTEQVGLLNVGDTPNTWAGLGKGILAIFLYEVIKVVKNWVKKMKGNGDTEPPAGLSGFSGS